MNGVSIILTLTCTQFIINANIVNLIRGNLLPLSLTFAGAQTIGNNYISK